jgi:hypothetical protein
MQAFSSQSLSTDLQNPKLRPENSILKLFKNKNKQYIKQENLRAQIIRALKRSIRQALDEVQSKSLKISKITKKIHNFEVKDTRALLIWGQLKDLAVTSNLLQDICRTEEGPETDGKSKKIKSTQKSFNKKFCWDFFRHEEVRRYFSYYIELVFNNFNSKTMAKKFEVWCCELVNGKEVHSSQCMLKWLIFKDYLSSHFLLELNLEPIEQNQFISLPDLEEVIRLNH